MNLPSCHSTMSAVGFYLPGVNRRPIMPRAMWQHVLQQLRAALTARPDDVAVCRGNFGRFGGLDDCRSLRSSVRRDGLDYVQAALAGNILPPLAVAARRPQPRSRGARTGPCALGCASSAGRAHGLQAWHGMPAAWGVAAGLLGADFFADDAIIGCLDDDSVLCAKHYRHVTRALGKAVVQSADAPPPTAADAPT